ncbi:MAG: hypothetical protein K8T20_03950 [Planctomycetes bacterium]|nr:hypothetical protein [Planctomycetota bacterium]
MRNTLMAAGRVMLVFCVVTTAALAIFVTTLWAGGFLTATRVDAAVRGLRAEAPPREVVPAATAQVTGPTPGDLRELETLVTMAEARDRDLRQQSDRIRAERRTTEKAAEAKSTVKATVPGTGIIPVSAGTPASPAGDRFKTNLDILRSHTPKVAAALMAEWETAEIVGYLRAMKPYEASDILSAMVGMARKGEVDYTKKAKEVQAALGK